MIPELELHIQVFMHLVLISTEARLVDAAQNISQRIHIWLALWLVRKYVAARKKVLSVW